MIVREERMKKAGIRVLPRQGRPEPAGPAFENVKIFLDNGVERLYPPRFIWESPTLRG
jgi:hypothetical protein